MKITSPEADFKGRDYSWSPCRRNGVLSLPSWISMVVKCSSGVVIRKEQCCSSQYHSAASRAKMCSQNLQTSHLLQRTDWKSIIAEFNVFSQCKKITTIKVTAMMEVYYCMASDCSPHNYSNPESCIFCFSAFLCFDSRLEAKQHISGQVTPTFKCLTDKKITQDVTTGKMTCVFQKHFPSVGGVLLSWGGKEKVKISPWVEIIVSVTSILHSYPKLCTCRALDPTVLDMWNFLLNHSSRSSRGLILPYSKVEVKQQEPVFSSGLWQGLAVVP